MNAESYEKHNITSMDIVMKKVLCAYKQESLRYLNVCSVCILIMSSPNEDSDLVSQLTVTTLLKSYIEDSL